MKVILCVSGQGKMLNGVALPALILLAVTAYSPALTKDTSSDKYAVMKLQPPLPPPTLDRCGMDHSSAAEHTHLMPKV